MSLSPQIRQFIHPVLQRLGFSNVDGGWFLENDDNWITMVQTSSSKASGGGSYLDIDIGFFSRCLDTFMGKNEQAGFDQINCIPVPNGLYGCHFESSLFYLDNNGEWTGISPNLVLPTGKESRSAFLEIAEKLEQFIPKAFERYATYESLIECKRSRIGRSAGSKDCSLYAAAACIKLGRIAEASAFLEDAVRPGSDKSKKDVGARLKGKMEGSS